MITNTVIDMKKIRYKLYILMSATALLLYVPSKFSHSKEEQSKSPNCVSLKGFYIFDGKDAAD